MGKVSYERIELGNRCWTTRERLNGRKAMPTDKPKLSAALIIAAAVQIHCPHCAQPFASPNGSHMWTEDEFTDVCGGAVKCRDCGEMFDIKRRKTAQIG